MLDGQQKGITLRAYLAKKLQCDPMRITKKYTGACCLGKRIYSINNSKIDLKEIEKARYELDSMEKKFHDKLEEIERKKNSTDEFVIEEKMIVSTPAIDALLNSFGSLNQRNQKPKEQSIPVPQIPFYYPYPYMVPPPPQVFNTSVKSEGASDSNSQCHNNYPFSRKSDDETDHDSLSNNSHHEDSISEESKSQPVPFCDYYGNYGYYQVPMVSQFAVPIPPASMEYQKRPLEYFEDEPQSKKSKLTSNDFSSASLTALLDSFDYEEDLFAIPMPPPMANSPPKPFGKHPSLLIRETSETLAKHLNSAKKTL